METSAQTHLPQGLSPTEESLLAKITEATQRTVALWHRDVLDSDATSPGWRPLANPLAAAPSEQSAPTELLNRAAGSADPVHQIDRGDPNRTQIAFRLAEGSCLGVLDCPSEEAPLLTNLLSALARESSLARQTDELQRENDSFAAQLTSDLEELTFLRAMVDQLSCTRVDDEPLVLTESTLSVLNATVRARCLAYLNAPNPDDPLEVQVSAIEGDQQLTEHALADLVRGLGPLTESQVFVKNWDVTDLADTPTRWDDDACFPGVTSVVLAPLVAGDKRFGWLIAVNRTPTTEVSLERAWQLASDEFGSGEASLMATTASILAAHAANTELLTEKENLMVGMVRSLVSAIEAKDNYTRGHSERVALFTKRLSEQMGYDAAASEQIYLTALLHDVGKIGVSDAVLKKEGKLTAEEYAEIAKHPDEGWAILGDLEHLNYVLPGVLHHHERWDGRGYPDGLAAETIPLDGRLLAVTDAYDAMTSDRPYRKGMPEAKAEAILREGAGIQWDPECIDAFFACLDDIHRIKANYRQRPQPRRIPEQNEPAAGELPHEVEGV